MMQASALSAGQESDVCREPSADARSSRRRDSGHAASSFGRVYPRIEGEECTRETCITHIDRRNWKVVEVVQTLYSPQRSCLLLATHVFPRVPAAVWRSLLGTL